MTQTTLPRGPVFLDVENCELTSADRARLAHPLVGGVILFSRNFAECAQLAALTAAIHALRSPPLLIAVDHEGGRVQRFRAGFTAIPPMRALGELWDRDRGAATREAQRLGYILAHELRAHGVDFSFAPVLDLDFGGSSVIGDRAFHSSAITVAQLASSLRIGMNAGGCAAVGKHFPGHGYVVADSHFDVPVDDRSLERIMAEDLVPFARLAQEGLEAVMPAHVIYPEVDSLPAGYSRIWLKDILRGQLAFDGVIFSDDLGMAGAHTAGDIVARADAAINAGCDMVLTCNDHPTADVLLSRWQPAAQPELAHRAARMEGRPSA